MYNKNYVFLLNWLLGTQDGKPSYRYVILSSQGQSPGLCYIDIHYVMTVEDTFFPSFQEQNDIPLLSVHFPLSALLPRVIPSLVMHSCN